MMNREKPEESRFYIYVLMNFRTIQFFGLGLTRLVHTLLRGLIFWFTRKHHILKLYFSK